MRNPTLLSLVIPMHNEAESLGQLFTRLATVLQPLKIPYEIVCIDDGSRDGTWDTLTLLRRTYPQLHLLRLSRNFGKEAALTAGLAHAAGDVVIPLDADLQDPPELIPELLQKWREGADVVLAVRKSRPQDTWLKRHSAEAFYHLFNKLSPTKIHPNAGDFRAMDKAVVQTLTNLPETVRFMKGLYGWAGYPTAQVEYIRPERAAGQTKFNYWKLWNFALDGIFSFSTTPLRVWMYIGLTTAALALTYGAWLLLRTLIWGIELPGYASLMVSVLFMGGLQLFTLGLMAEYLGRIFQEVKRRPPYVIAQQHPAKTTPTKSKR